MALNPRQKLLKQQGFKKMSTAERVKQAQLARQGLTPDPNAPRLGDDRKKGVFTNPNTGETTDKFGNPVDANGKKIAEATPEAPVRTYEQMGESLAQESYNVSDLEKELYGDTKTETSMDKFFNNLIAEQERQAQRSKEALDYQQAENIAQGAEAQKQIRSGTEAQLAQLTAGGREGVTGGTLPSRLKEVQGTQLARLQASAQESQAQIEDVRAKLAVAEREGRRDLVNAYQQQLDAYTVQAQEAEANLVSALSEQATTQAQITQTGIASFQSLVESGTEMDYNTISGLASQYGLPTDMLMGYYQGAQSIRDDKTLSLEEKQVALDQAKQDLNDQISGLRTAESKNIAYLDQLRQMGAPEEIISAFKSVAGITDYNDPLTQAELQYKNLENEIKQKQMNGEPVSVSDYETLFDLKQKMDASTGTGGTAYVSPSIDGIAMTYEGGQLNVTLPTNPDGTLKAYQCGEFVNRAWGLTSGGSGGFGSTSASKQDLVSRNGFFTEGKSFPELLGLVKPGMAFASYAGSTDHTGLIISAPDAQGNYMTLEANVGDDNPYVSDPPIYKTRNIKDQDVYGFVYPPNGQPIEGAQSNPLLQQQADALIFDLGGTADERSLIASNMVQMVESGVATDLADAKAQLGLITKSDRDLQDSMTAEIKPLREDYNTAKSKLASLPQLLANGQAVGDVASIVNFLKVIDPNSVARETEVASIENATSLLGQMEQAYQKLLTGEKLTDEQREQLGSTANILASSFADSYLQELYRRQEELRAKGVPMTFASQSEIASLESFLGTDRVNQIKEGLGLEAQTSPEDDYLNTLIDYGTNSDIYDYVDELAGGSTQTAQPQSSFTQTSPNGRPTWMQNIYSQSQK